MIRARGQVAVERPASQVFRWIANPDLASRWQPDVTSHEITRPTEALVGTEFVETLRGNGETAEVHGRVAAYQPDQLIAFDLDGPGVTVRARYVVGTTTNGSVVRADVAVDPARPVPALLRPFIGWRMRRQLRRELNTLRRLCEAEPLIDTEEETHGQSRGALGDRRP